MIGSIVLAALTSIAGAVVMLLPFVGGLGALIIVLGIIGLVFGIIIIVGAAMINSGDPSKVRTGSIIVLIFSILSLPLSGGGFIIGFILALVGSILGLVWKPSERPSYPPPPPPPP